MNQADLDRLTAYGRQHSHVGYFNHERNVRDVGQWQYGHPLSLHPTKLIVRGRWLVGRGDALD